MSDNNQLFQNTDSQEAAYAPQELPSDSHARRAAEIEGGQQETSAGAGGDDLPSGGLAIPGGGTGMAGNMVDLGPAAEDPYGDGDRRG